MSSNKDPRSSSPASDRSTPPVRKTTNYEEDYGTFANYYIDDEHPSTASYAADALIAAVDGPSASTPLATSTTTTDSRSAGNDASKQTSQQRNKKSRKASTTSLSQVASEASDHNASTARRSSRRSSQQQAAVDVAAVPVNEAPSPSVEVEGDGDAVMTDSALPIPQPVQPGPTRPRPRLILKGPRSQSDASQPDSISTTAPNAPKSIALFSAAVKTTPGAATTGTSLPSASATGAASQPTPPVQQVPQAPSVTPAALPATQPAGRGNRNRAAHATPDWTWQEEANILSFPAGLSRGDMHTRHNAWLQTNRYAYQRGPDAVWQRINQLNTANITAAYLRQRMMS